MKQIHPPRLKQWWWDHEGKRWRVPNSSKRLRCHQIPGHVALKAFVFHRDGNACRRGHLTGRLACMLANPPPDCPGCGERYRTFRTGMSFAEVRAQFWKQTADQKQWVNKRRNTVLGRWHEIKQHMWAQHVGECSAFFSRSA